MTSAIQSYFPLQSPRSLLMSSEELHMNFGCAHESGGGGGRHATLALMGHMPMTEIPQME